MWGEFCNNEDEAIVDSASIPNKGGQIRVWDYSTGEMSYYTVDEDELDRIINNCNKTGEV